mmetsp:Transcript_20968/g.83591  ORF Transcript_20968/g.83591 Transcript_20968/m.83591 type:complete len:284 (-) Transcript_20968:145-996(-)
MRHRRRGQLRRVAPEPRRRLVPRRRVGRGRHAVLVLRARGARHPRPPRSRRHARRGALRAPLPQLRRRLRRRPGRRVARGPNLLLRRGPRHRGRPARRRRPRSARLVARRAAVRRRRPQRAPREAGRRVLLVVDPQLDAHPRLRPLDRHRRAAGVHPALPGPRRRHRRSTGEHGRRLPHLLRRRRAFAARHWPRPRRRWSPGSSKWPASQAPRLVAAHRPRLRAPRRPRPLAQPHRDPLRPGAAQPALRGAACSCRGWSTTTPIILWGRTCGGAPRRRLDRRA